MDSLVDGGERRFAGGDRGFRQLRNPPFFVRYLRFYESAEIEPLILLNGRITLPESSESHTPHWQPT